MRGRGLLVPTVLAVASLVAAAPAAADPSVTITPPSGPTVHSLPNDLRITDRQPTFAILGSDGSTLTCNFDNQSSGGQATFGPCGQQPASCSGSVCADFRPSAPLAAGYHSLAVELDGPDGSAQANVSFWVDLSPPGTSIDGPIGPALRPSFTVSITEDDQFSRSDSVQCSLTRLNAPAAWHTCASNLRGGDEGTFRPKLPDRHVDYRFEARGVDDFGRPDLTPPTVEFDPVPCAVQARSIGLGQLISSGIPVTLNCSYLRKVQLDFFLLAKNGTRTSIGSATNNRPNLGYQQITSRRLHYTVHRTLRMFAEWDSYFRTYRSAVLVVRAKDPNDEVGLPGYAVINVHY
jgi:hypothetical protein